MKTTRQTIVFDAADIETESRFWAEVLEGQVVGDAEWKSVRTAEGVVSVGVQLAPQHRPSRWPEEPARSHLDLWVADHALAHQEVIAHGARLVREAEAEDNFNVYASPAGNIFCLVWPVD
ncbi:VOC family protein [Glutamicibacter endophyticus]